MSEEQTQFVWPQDQSSRLIDATEFEEAAEAARAFAALKEQSRGGQVHWRGEPEWRRERQFETQQNISFLRLRAILVWSS